MAFPSRRAIFMLAIVLTIAVAIGVMMLRPGSLSPVEQGLVGTWDVQIPPDPSKHDPLVFEADREFRLTDGTLLGRWRVSGSELVLEYSNTNYLSTIYSMITRANRYHCELTIDPGGTRLSVKQLGGVDAVLTRTPTE